MLWPAGAGERRGTHLSALLSACIRVHLPASAL